MAKRLKAYIYLLNRYIKVLLGKSYYHVQKSAGKNIVRNKVKGYYLDYSEKADWAGKTDLNGIPLITLSNGMELYFPITVAQMALGHYEIWLENNNSHNKEYFLRLAGWLRDNQDGRGGWVNPWEYLRPSCISNYSAMTQGQAVSVMIRAHILTQDESFLNSSYRAFNHMIKPVVEAGCSYIEEESIYLEEYPESPRSTVLNGWIYAAFGVYDLMLFTNDKKVEGIFNNTINALKSTLGSYDMGYWTYYDLHGLIASPYYHELHITLLEVLYELTGLDEFKSYYKKWLGYRRSFFSRNKALLQKAVQRFKDPSLITIAK